MSIKLIGRPFSTIFNNGERKIRVVVCECLECGDTFCTRNSSVKFQKSCGCKNGRRYEEIKEESKGRTTPVNCDNCGVVFNKRIADLGRTKRNYCSRNCAAVYNNKIRPKRKRSGKCFVCKSEIYGHLKYCDKCKPSYIGTQIKDTTKEGWWIQHTDKTLKDLMNTKTFKCNLFTAVRDRARRIALAMKYDCCCICGYDLRIEIAHIKSVASFPEDAKISEVNHPNNLAPLCPNCHFEFDNNFITEEELRTRLVEYFELKQSCESSSADV